MVSIVQSLYLRLLCTLGAGEGFVLPSPLHLRGVHPEIGAFHPGACIHIPPTLIGSTIDNYDHRQGKRLTTVVDRLQRASSGMMSQTAINEALLHLLLKVSTQGPVDGMCPVCYKYHNEHAEGCELAECIRMLASQVYAGPSDYDEW